MNVGTRSILFGVHQFLMHPFFVAAAWWKLYGFPWDPRLWIAFFVHDLGYLGKPNMDGAEIMRTLFGEKWGRFCLYHSRFYARRDGAQFSQLCVADKLATALMPAWLYLPLANLSGEIREYMDVAHHREGGRYSNECRALDTQREWFASMCDYMRRWIAEHKDCRPDTWTPGNSSDDVTIHIAQAVGTGREECWRCVGLGLRPYAWIPRGELFVLITRPGGELCACADCYARLCDEIEREEEFAQ